MTANLAQLL